MVVFCFQISFRINLGYGKIRRNMKKISTYCKYKHGKNKNFCSLLLGGKRKNDPAAEHHSFSSEKHVSHRMIFAIKLKQFSNGF